MAVATMNIFLALGAAILVDVAAIIIGLLIFFKGRNYVRRKYGKK